MNKFFRYVESRAKQREKECGQPVSRLAVVEELDEERMAGRKQGKSGKPLKTVPAYVKEVPAVKDDDDDDDDEA